jgi:hypothetical protein
MTVSAPAQAGDDDAASSSRSSAPRRSQHTWLGWGLLALAVAGAWPVAELIRLAIQSGHPTYLSGDQALIDLAARRAWHLDQLVGPYSRYGWHHPGPALFYLLAIPVRIFEPQGPGVYFGTVLINGAAAVATVAVVWRRAGATAALGAAVAVDALCLSLSMTVLQYPWNPYVIVLPLVLFTVLWADAVRGRPGSLAWAAVVGSFAAQTHISAAPYAAVMVVVAVVAFAVARRRRDGPTDRPGWVGVGSVTGLVVFVACWLPVVVELVRDHPNNLTLLWDYFTQSHQSPPLLSALRQSFNAMTVLPFGYHAANQYLIRSDTHLALGGAGMLVVILVSLVVAWFRRQDLAPWVTLSAVLAGIIGVAATTRAAGGLFDYLVVWQTFIPATLLIGLAVAIFGPAGPADAPLVVAHHRRARAHHDHPGSRVLVGVTCLGALIIAPVTVRSDLRVTSPWRTNRTVGVLAAAGERVLRPSDRWVNVTIGTAAIWPDAAGFVDELERADHRTTVSPASWVVEFGHERLPDHPVSVRFDVYPQGDRAAAAAFGGTIVVTKGDDVLAYKRTAGSAASG